jgi:hypothetical protein
MYDEDKSVSIAVNRKQVCSSGHCGAVSGEMLVMHDAHMSGKLGGCSKEASWDKTSWGVCEHVCRGGEARRCGLGSDRGSEKRPEDSREAQGDQMGSAERVCDRRQGFARLRPLAATAVEMGKGWADGRGKTRMWLHRPSVYIVSHQNCILAGNWQGYLCAQLP